MLISKRELPLWRDDDQEDTMTANRQVHAETVIDDELPWQRAISDGLQEAQAHLAQLTPNDDAPMQEGWQIVGQAFESGLRALQSMRG